MPRNPGCSRCRLSQTTKNRCVWGVGSARRRIVLVGEAPGAEEERTGVPFVGPAGATLDRLLAAAGLNRHDVYITNTARCRPPQNRAPRADEIGACLPYLLEEFASIGPAVIVALGATAIHALTGRNGVAANRGKALDVHPRLRLSAPVVATYHPSAYLRSSDSQIRDAIIADLRLAEQLSRPKETLPYSYYPHGPYESPEARAAALEALDRLADGASWVAVDLEWVAGDRGLLWPWSRGAEALSLSVCGVVGDEAIAVAVSLPEGEGVRERVQRVLSTCRVVAHNATADLIWLIGLRYQRIRLEADTMILSQLHEAGQPASLEAVTGRYAPRAVRPGWKGHLYHHRPGLAAEWAELLRYNADDTYATLQTFHGLAASITSERHGEETLRLHRELLIPALRPLVRAAVVGVPIDVELLTSMLDESRAASREAVSELSRLSGLPPAEARALALSPQRLKAYLADYLELEIEDTEAATLDQYRGYPVVEAVLAVRAWAKTLGTYLEPWAGLLDGQNDSRLHTIYRPVGARTGRLSAETEQGGSLLTAPRNNARLPFRRLVRARPGYVIVAGDLSQIELRVLAWLAGEEMMLGFLRAGEDLHRATAAFVAAQPMDIEEFVARRHELMGAVTKDARQRAKGVNFGFAFGMQVEAFTDYARMNYGVQMTPGEAREARDGYFRLYGGLQGYHNRQRALAMRREPTVTPFGRRRHFPEGSENAAINTPVQSTASDLTLLAFVQFDRALTALGLDAVPVGIVHDAILVEARAEQAEEVAALLRETMEHPDTSAFGFTVPVPLVADIAIAESWG